jgi:beta-glucanase (GH16 family)
MWIGNANADGWQLIWNDEFNYKGVPDPTKWGIEVNANPPNGESEYYTNSPNNVHVDSGNLYLTGLHQTMGNKSYTSGKITSQNKASWTYGRVEARCILAPGQGSWPAFWMLGANISSVGWPTCGEIDIAEYKGSVANNVEFNLHGGGFNAGGNKNLADPGHTYHIYALEWFADHLDAWFDSTKIYTYTKPANSTDGNWPYYRPEYILFDEALGGGFGGTINNSIFPTNFVVDYARVYTWSASGIYPLGHGAPIVLDNSAILGAAPSRDRFINPVLRVRNGQIDFIPNGYNAAEPTSVWNALGRMTLLPTGN